MKLYIKQKVFSWRERFAVKGEDGEDRFFAQGEIFTLGRKLHVFDSYGSEAAYIHRKLLSFFPRYFIEAGGRSFTLVKEFSPLAPRLRLEGTPWRMDGNFWEHEYALYDDKRLIMGMTKHWFTWGDSYELDIPNPGDELWSLCIALAVDCMRADAQDASRN